MTPEETRAALIQKFERDVAKRSRWYRFLLVLDQMGNVIFWNGSCSCDSRSWKNCNG